MDRPFLIGETIYLRPFENKYIEEGYGHLINNRNVIKYLPSSWFPKPDEELEQYIESSRKDPNTIFFAVTDKETNNYIGNAKIVIDWISRRAKYSLVLSDQVQGKGYGTDLLRLLIVYVFEILNLRILETFVNVTNNASIKSNKKVGMKEVVLIKKYEYIGGDYQDIILFILRKSDYADIRNEDSFKTILELNSTV